MTQSGSDTPPAPTAPPTDPTDRTSKYLAEFAEKANIPAECIQPLRQYLAPLQSTASDLAKTYQRGHRRASRGVFCLSAAAVTVAVAQIVLYRDRHWLVLCELAFMVLACLCLAANRFKKWHTKWLENRYTAEQLRIWTYVLVAGEVNHLDDHAAERLPYYKSLAPALSEKAKLAVKQAIKCLKQHQDLENLRKFLIDAWLGDQQKWHHRNGEAKHGIAHRVHIALYLIFASTFLAAVLHYLEVGHHAHFVGALVSDWISALAIVLPAWGGAIHGISKQFQHERVAVRSTQMAAVLAQLVDRAKKAETLNELRAVVADAAQIMSLENFEWAAQISLEPGDPPT